MWGRARKRETVNDPDWVSLPDEELVRLAERDSDAFGHLYERYHDEIEGFIRSRVGGNDAIAQDVTSEVFTKALTALPRYTDGPFRAWVYQIARNSVIDYHRRKKPVGSTDGLLHLVSHEAPPDERAIASEADARLHEAIAHLNPRQREILTYRLHGYSAVEAGQHLGMKPDAIKSAQHRAFRKLRSLLGERP